MRELLTFGPLKQEMISTGLEDGWKVGLYSVQVRDVGWFLAMFNPLTNTFGNL